MVSWLTCIEESSGNSLRSRRAISSGDHNDSSPLVTLSHKGPLSSFEGFGRKVHVRALTWAGHIRYPSRPPFALTSLVTEDVDRLRSLAIWLIASPRWRPSRISSRSPAVRFPSRGV